MKISSVQRLIPNHSEFSIQPSKFIRHSSFRIQNSALFVLAEVDIGRDLKFQGNTSAAGIPEFQDLGSLISQWLPNVYVVAGLVLFFFILLGGIGFISAAGNQEEIQKSQKVLTSAILGFAILFGSYWIIQIIQVLTGIPILKPNL